MTPESELLPQALKGLLAALGAGSGITRSAQPVSVSHIERGAAILSGPIVDAVVVAGQGAILSIASKALSFSESRIVVDQAITHAVRARAPSGELVELLRAHDPKADSRTLTMLDRGGLDDEWVLPPRDPNRSCHELSSELLRETGARVDVVASDSGAGVGKGTDIIGAATFFSTPIGATAGLSLAHAQRCAVINEFFGNRAALTPAAVVTPESWRSRNRERIGEFRYPGYLNAARESLELR